MTENYSRHIVLECKGIDGETFHVDLYREEVMDLLKGSAVYDDTFLEYLNDDRFKRKENSINFFCKYKENFISIRRVIKYYCETAPLVALEPKSKIFKYTRTYDAAVILLELGIEVLIVEESVSGKSFFSKYKNSPYLIIKNKR